MKKLIKSAILLVIAFILGWLVGLYTYVPLENTMVLRSLPEGFGADDEWLPHANISKVGNYLILADPERQSYSLRVIPLTENLMPIVEFKCVSREGANADHYGVSSIRAYDSEGKHIEVMDPKARGVFERYLVATGKSPHDFSFMDANFNGEADFRIRPHVEDASRHLREVRINGIWHDLIIRDGVMYADTPEGLIEFTLPGGGRGQGRKGSSN